MNLANVSQRILRGFYEGSQSRNYYYNLYLKVKKMKEMLLIVNSKDGRNKSADGSSFDVVFDTPISTGGTPHLKVLSSTIWYTFPNVITASNDTLVIRYGAALTYTATLTIPQGLYSIQDLNSAIQHQIESQGLSTALGSKTVLSIGANYATGKATVTITIPTSMPSQHIQIDWVTSTISSLLGFSQNVELNAASSVFEKTFFGDTVANMAPVASLQIRCSSVRGSVVSGTTGSDVLASVQINARPGYQINYEPSVTPRVPAPSFMNGISSMRMRLTDQDGTPVNTQYEDWGATLLLEW